MENELREFLEQKIEFYNLMSMVFMKEPGEDFCNILWEMLKEDYFPLTNQRPDIHTFHEQIRDYLSETTSADFAKAMKQEYYDLFFDPYGIKASPWQSSYTNRDNLLYQAPDYETKAFYRRYGYEVSNNHLPGDHISIELDFLKRLAEKELEIADTAKLNENTAVFSDNLEFVKKYLLDWIDDFMKNLSLSGSVYYLLFASMAKAAGELDKKILQNLLKKEKKEEED